MITAKKGEIISQEGSRYLTLILEDGFYYEDIIADKSTQLVRKKMAFTKAHFDKYEVNIDVSNIGDFDPDDVKYKTGKETLRAGSLTKDTVQGSPLESNIMDNFDEEGQRTLVDNAYITAQGNVENVNNFNDTLKDRQKIINGYNTEYHKRIAFSVACLVLFFVGTPLGSIIRKGGFGLPMIMAIVIFVIYFFISTLGKNMAESNTVSPFIGGWLATFVLLPLGILLMIRATNDKGIFNVDAFLQPLTNLINRVFKLDKKQA